MSCSSSIMTLSLSASAETYGLIRKHGRHARIERDAQLALGPIPSLALSLCRSPLPLLLSLRHAEKPMSVGPPPNCALCSPPISNFPPGLSSSGTLIGSLSFPSCLERACPPPPPSSLSTRSRKSASSRTTHMHIDQPPLLTLNLSAICLCADSVTDLTRSARRSHRS